MISPPTDRPSDDALGDKVAAVLNEHFSHEGGMSFDADELVAALIGNLAFHLALLPAMRNRAARRNLSKDVAEMLSAMIQDASRELDEAGISQAVTATPIHRGVQ